LIALLLFFDFFDLAPVARREQEFYLRLPFESRLVLEFLAPVNRTNL
jgi:hypothetical protein